MDNNIFGLVILGVGILGGFVYKYSNEIKIEYLKQKGIYQAKQVTIDFFVELLKQNSQISLDDAILKFENADLKYKNLEDFSKDKNRNVSSYHKAYSELFIEAKRKIV